jgi:hypothetical protein
MTEAQCPVGEILGGFIVFLAVCSPIILALLCWAIADAIRAQGDTKRKEKP